MNQRFRSALMACLGLVLISAGPPAEREAADKDALRGLQDLVGGWNGTGQPQRGSSRGAWTETADWKWEFHDGRAALTMTVKDGKYFASARLQPADKAGEYELIATTADGKTTETFRGKKSADGKLILDAAKPVAGRPARLTLQTVAEGARLSFLVEQATGEGQFSRLAEIGYTREGSRFGKGSSGPECVVTGGLGTMTVSFQGETYFVCCTGCRDAFNESPAKILAEYRDRKAKEK